MFWMNKVGSFQRVWSLLGVVCTWNSNHALLNPRVILISESSKISQHDTGLKEEQRIYISVITNVMSRYDIKKVFNMDHGEIHQGNCTSGSSPNSFTTYCTGPGRWIPVRCNNHENVFLIDTSYYICYTHIRVQIKRRIYFFFFFF